jgi:hypothetical protein
MTEESTIQTDGNMQLRKLAYLKFHGLFFKFTKSKHLGNIRNLVSQYLPPQNNISEVRFTVTEITILNFEASSNKFYCNNLEM